MRSLWIAIVLATLFPLTAEAKIWRFHGSHPLPHHGGYCFIDWPHVHSFAPGDTRVYRVHDDEYYFVGDPTPFGYDGQRYSYYGPHPLAELTVSGEPAYCYMVGPHYHVNMPPPNLTFEQRSGVYFYMGAFPPTFVQERPRYVVINEAYRPLVYERPVVDIAIVPPTLRATAVIGVGGRVEAVAAPPAVGVGVHIGLPPPPTVQVGVGVGFVGGPAPPPQVIERDRVVVVHDREFHGREHERHENENDQGHDNGRHEGWFKKAKHERW
jgi:hypothetical protein